MKAHTLAIARQLDSIPYRKELNLITGSVIASIFFQQVLYWWDKNKGKEFFKFKGPCDHSAYNEGDSWCEEIGCSNKEFDTARSLVGAKFSSKVEKDPKALIWYRVDSSRLTYYSVNEELVDYLIEWIYENDKKGFTKSIKKDLLTISTENTTERKNFTKKEKAERAREAILSTKSDLNQELEKQQREKDFRNEVRRIVKKEKSKIEDWKYFFGGTSQLDRLTSDIAHELAVLDYQGELKDYIWKFVRNGRDESIWEEEPVRRPDKIQTTTEDPFDGFDNPEKAREVWAMWLRYKAKKPYANNEVKQIAFKDFVKYSGGSAGVAEEMISRSMKAGWPDFYEPKEKTVAEVEKEREVNKSDVHLWLRSLYQQWEEMGPAVKEKPYAAKIQEYAAKFDIEVPKWHQDCLKHLKLWKDGN